MSHPAAALNSLDSIFGDGATGSLSLSGGSHAFNDSAFTTLAISNNSSGFTSRGVRIFVKDTFTTSTQSVTITASGLSGGVGTAGYLGGTGGAANTLSTKQTVCVGGQGEGGALLNGAVCDSSNTAGNQIIYIFGGKGGAGGQGGFGVWGGGPTYEDPGTITANGTPKRQILTLNPNNIWERLMASNWYASQGGGGGGGGAGCAYVSSGFPNGGGGGAGGNGGELVMLFVKKLVLNTNLTIDARGGTAGSGSVGTNVVTDGNGAGGTGGGGGGGAVILVVGERTGSGTLTVNVSGGDSYYGFASGGIGGNSNAGYGGSHGALWYVNLAAGISTYHAGSDAAQSGITGEAAVYTL